MNDRQYYEGRHIDELICKKSSSGGAFSAISDYIIKKKQGVIYGCVLDGNMNAVHKRATTVSERNAMRGSKYISSSLNEMYINVKHDLEVGRYVLFTGTPCQIDAIKSYLSVLNTNTDKLFTVEVICHGVGSPKFFHDYIDNLQDKYKSKAVLCNFRAKHYRGQKQDMEVVFENKKRYNASSTKYDWFYSVYLRNLILRPSCYCCKYANENRCSDICIADLWEENDADYEKSLIIINTEKGKEVFENITALMALKKVEKETVHQPHMIKPCEKPQQRDEFWKIYSENGYLEVQKWIGNNTVRGKIKDKIAKNIYKFGLAKLAKQLRKKIYE